MMGEARRAHPLELATRAATLRCPGYIQENALRPLLDDASQLPGTVDWVAFERKLGVDSAAIDLSVSVSRSQARAFVAGLSSATPSEFRDMLGSWADLRDPEWEHVPHVWLEFDHDAAAKRPLWARGFCFLGLVDGCRVGGAQPMVAALVRRLSAGRIGPEQEARAVEVEQQLPWCARMLHVAYLSHRGRPEVRFHFLAPVAEVPSLLSRLDWGGDTHALGETLAVFEAIDLPQVAVQLAVFDRLEPSGGFELFLPEKNAQLRWPSVFERMQALGLMNAYDAAQVQGWHGRSTFSAADFPGQPVPAALDLTRRTHVKFTITKDGFGPAKAYLFGYPRFVPF